MIDIKEMLNKNYGTITLTIIFLLNFFLLSPLLLQGFAYGDDNTSHYVVTVRVAEMIQEGNFRFWNPDYDGGYPLFYYYQPVGTILTSLVYIIFPFLSTLFLFKFLIIFLFSLFPLTIYFGMQWMGIKKQNCIIAALLATAIKLPNVKDYFGFDSNAYLIWGLYSMLFAMIFYPLAVGYTCKEYFGRRGYFMPVLLLSLTFLSHSFVGIAANISILLLLFFSPKQFSIKNKWDDLKYISEIFLLELIIISFWLFPFLINLEYYGGHPFDSAERMYGFGFSKIMSQFLSGYIFDFERIPLFTVFIVIGIIFISYHFYKEYTSNKKSKKEEDTKTLERNTSKYMLLNFLVFIILLSGPTTFLFLRLFPGNGFIHFSRFWSGLDVFGIMVASIGATYVYMKIIAQRKKRLWKGISVIMIILFLLFTINTVVNINAKAKTFVLDNTFIKTMDFLKKKEDGRIHIHESTGINKHFMLHIPPLYADKPITISYARGVHDNLGFFYLESLPLTNTTYANLFNIKYIVAINEKNYSGERVYQNENYSIYKRNTTGYFDVIQTNTVLLTENKKARKVILQWAKSELLQREIFLTIANEKDKDYFEALGFENFIEEADLDSLNTTEYALVRAPEEQECGTVLSEVIEDGYYKAEVQSNNQKLTCYVMLKVNAHPDWTARIDGIKVPWIQVSPSFMAVQLPSGEHTIAFEFGISKLRILLFILSITTGILLLFYEMKQRQ